MARRWPGTAGAGGPEPVGAPVDIVEGVEATWKPSWARVEPDGRNVPKAFRQVKRRLAKSRLDEALRGVSETTQMAVEKPAARDRLACSTPGAESVSTS